MVGRQVTFYATSDVYDIIKGEGIEHKKQSKWINEKIKKAIQFEKNNMPVKSEVKNIGVEL